MSRRPAFLATVIGLLAIAFALSFWTWGADPTASIASAQEADPVHPHAHKLKNPDGTWKYTNALARESSPYLRLHAHNPVDWYPWGSEALRRAVDEDRPIFLSVGYSTCYWCHVMERLVFSDPEIAGLMNQWFVNIKVDREERPDLDDIYMTATHLIDGRGGWPNSVFLTPDLRPFFAGTYFPPEGAHGRLGFSDVLRILQEAWMTQRDVVEEQADRITASLERLQSGGQRRDDVRLDRALVDRVISAVRRRFDADSGGFGGAPKFPPDQDLALLLAEYERTGDASLLEMVTHTLVKMADGGIHDHLGGGFHRYATDGRWLVPHFEKMLYNQAFLTLVYLDAYRLTKQPRYRQTVEGMLTFVRSTLTDAAGGFYSALDAETDGEEGRYYVWKHEEIEGILRADADAFFERYGLEPMPEGGAGVLHVRYPKNEGSATHLSRLLAARHERERPLLDTKVLTAWNGMMIEAYVRAFEVLGDSTYLNAARDAASFVERNLSRRSRLKRSYAEGGAHYAGYLEDYAFFAGGLIALYEATGDAAYLSQAIDFTDTMVEVFWDADAGGFFFTDGKEDLLVRTKRPHDSAIPSGNSVAALLLLDLSQTADRPDFRKKAETTLQAFASSMERNPLSHKVMALALHRYLGDASEIVVGSDGGETPSSNLVQAEMAVVVSKVTPKGTLVELEIRVDVKRGWHVNANPASLDFLVPTSLTLRGNGVEVRSIRYPEGREMAFAFESEKLSVLAGTFVVRASVFVEGAPVTLNGTLSYQACDDLRCLAPGLVEVSVRVER